MTATAADMQTDAIAAIRAQLAACHGCGAPLRDVDEPEHRPDCTVEPSPLLCDECGAIRLPSEKAPAWRYDPNTRTYHCPTHQKGTTE